jgi:predicted dehydrogenase
MKVRVGIVGCGAVAHKHAYELKIIKEAEVKAVAGIDGEKAKNFAMKLGVKRALEGLV